MYEKAYVIKSEHFKIQEMDFEQLKEYTDNVILEYSDMDYFKRSLFEMDRLGYNIGILYTVSQSNDLEKLLNAIRGFNINLGVWVDFKNDEISYNAFITLREKFNKNFITGIRLCPLLLDKDFSFIENIKDYPKWGPSDSKCDIESDTIIMPYFSHFSINTIRLNTNYKKIYEENNLKPIKSNEVITNILN